MIIRMKKKKNFTIISNEIFQNRDISARAKGIYCYLMTLPDDWKLYKTELPRHFKEGVRAIDVAFKELEEHNYITKKKNKNKIGRFDGWDYTVLETPHTDTSVINHVI